MRAPGEIAPAGAAHRWWLRVAWLLAVVGGGVAAGAAVPLLRAPRDTGAAALRSAADGLHARLLRGLQDRQRALESRAAEAASLPELISGFDMHVDTPTFQDLLETEDWWSPYRHDLAVSALYAEAGRPIVLGVAPGDLEHSEVVTTAREVGVASALVAARARDRVLILGAARIARGAGSVARAVVVLGAELEGRALGALAEDGAAFAVGLADGPRLIASGGADSLRAALIALAGRAAPGIVPLGPGQAGVAWPLQDRGGGGLSLISVFPTPASRRLPRGREARALAIGALLFAAGMMILVARRRAPGAGTAAGPQGALPMATWRAPLEGSASSAEAESPSTAALGSHAGDITAVRAPPAMGRYRLLERIGQGGMAEIFVAESEMPGGQGFTRRCVVKRMHPHLVRSPDATTQFIDEARLQARLIHSNIVPVLDFGREGGEYFMALEHVRGCDVDRLVRRRKDAAGGPLSLPISFYIVHSVLEALAFAHSAMGDDGRPLRVVHRDVAPGNILLSFGGEVKLSDFGIAKSRTRMSRTQLGAVKGNASFMSPEQARGEGVDARSDLFSAGVVLYYCLTGQLMYGDDQAVVKRLLRAASGSASIGLIDLQKIPAGAADIVQRAMTPDPAERYQSAREFARDLFPQIGMGRNDLIELLAQLFPDARRPTRA